VIAALRFGTPQLADDGRIVREPAFTLRSTLPLSAVCLVANGVREQLARLLGRDLEVDVLEPVVPRADERRVLFAGAVVQRVRGRLGDALLVVRPRDARKLVAAAFGEAERADDALSEIEMRTLERMIAAILPLCAPFCGALGAVSRETPERCEHECATYVEVRVAPLGVAIGFALTRDPPEEIGTRIALDALLDATVPVRVVLAEGALPIPLFARLEPGATVALATPLDEPGRLELGGTTIARGSCGTRAGRHALTITALATET